MVQPTNDTNKPYHVMKMVGEEHGWRFYSGADTIEDARELRNQVLEAEPLLLVKILDVSPKDVA